MPETRRDDNGDDFSHMRRRNGEESAATWVRWAVVLMLTLAVSALGFVVQLSNRMTAVEVKMDAMQTQRSELIGTIGSLQSQMGQLDRSIVTLTQQLQQLERDGARSRPPARMFDK